MNEGNSPRVKLCTLESHILEFESCFVLSQSSLKKKKDEDKLRCDPSLVSVIAY